MGRRNIQFDIRRPERWANNRKFPKVREPYCKGENFYYDKVINVDGYTVQVTHMYWKSNFKPFDCTMIQFVRNNILYYGFLSVHDPSIMTINKYTRQLIKTITPSPEKTK